VFCAFALVYAWRSPSQNATPGARLRVLEALAPREDPRSSVAAFMQPPPPRHFSMLRELHAADIFTLLNGAAGTGAILAFMDYCVSGMLRSFWIGSGLIPFALVMDILDGRVARLRKEVSPLGQELDSLADIVSFGVAPVAMGFAAGMRGGWDSLCFAVFVACGIGRLARYNVTATTLADATGKVRYFEGLPIPSSLLLVVLIFVLALTGNWQAALPFGSFALGPMSFHPLALIYVAQGMAMISKTLRVPKP